MTDTAAPVGDRPIVRRDRGESHACAWDAVGRYRVRAFCQAWMLRLDHTNDPTCPICREILAQRAREGMPF